jgi:hypothetical protein
VAKQPPRRARATNDITAPAVADPTTERALSEVREQVGRVRQSASAPLVSRVTFIAQRPTPTINRSLFDSDLDGELYYRDSEGRDIRLTEDGFISGSDVDVGPLPANVSAVTVNAAGDLNVNDAGNVIVDLYVTNLHTTGTDSHGSRFIEFPPELNAVISGAPINFTNGRGVGSAVGACSFYVTMPGLRRGDRILAVSGTFATGVGAGTSSINLKRRNADAFAPTTLGTASSGGTGTPLTVTLSGLTETVVAGKSYVLEVNTGRSQDSLETITVEYDRP